MPELKAIDWTKPIREHYSGGRAHFVGERTLAIVKSGFKFVVEFEDMPMAVVDFNGYSADGRHMVEQEPETQTLYLVVNTNHVGVFLDEKLAQLSIETPVKACVKVTYEPGQKDF